MVDRSFFDESKDQSLVKAAIVAKYFWAWAKVILKKTTKNIAYVDLFSGSGRYKDGSKSTPLLILEKAIADPDMTDPEKRKKHTFGDKVKVTFPEK
ncbi:MAG: three-Cys-motif partner protein TcmP [Spirulina sp.]